MFLNLYDEIKLPKDQSKVHLLKNLIQFKKINVFDYLFWIDFEEIANESCDQQCIQECKKEYRRLISKDPHSQQAKQILKYLKENTYQGKVREDFQQLKRLKKQIKKILNRELNVLDPLLAKRIRKSLFFTQV